MVSNLFSGFVQIATFHSLTTMCMTAYSDVNLHYFFSKECADDQLYFVGPEFEPTIYNASIHHDVIEWPTDQEYTLYDKITNTLYVSEIANMLIWPWYGVNSQLWRFLNAAISLLLCRLIRMEWSHLEENSLICHLLKQIFHY